MKINHLLLVLALGGVLLSSSAPADNIRTQTIQLQKGWNSVFLEVVPVESTPATVFSNTPISMVARYFPRANSVEFLQDPVQIDWKKSGWGVWYAPRRSDAFLSTLFAVEGNVGYLVYAEQEFVWSVQGRVSFEPVRWKSDSYNHVGFAVDAQSPPTFGKFFAGSRAHRERKVYRLVDERWVRLSNPDQALMRSGEACWIYCQGASDYHGPLAVEVAGGRGVVFGHNDNIRLVLANCSTDPIDIQTDLAGEAPPMSYVVRGLARDRLQDVFLEFPARHSLPTLEPGARSYLTLQVRRELMTQAFQSGVLRLSTDSGAVVWLAVAAQRQDLATNP